MRGEGYGGRCVGNEGRCVGTARRKWEILKDTPIYIVIPTVPNLKFQLLKFVLV